MGTKDRGSANVPTDNDDPDDDYEDDDAWKGYLITGLLYGILFGLPLLLWCGGFLWCTVKHRCLHK